MVGGRTAGQVMEFGAPARPPKGTKWTPILMLPHLAEATAWGLKHETRRKIKDGRLPLPELCPYGGPGDMLWVREPVKLRAIGPGWFDVVYKGGEDNVVQFPGIPHKVLKSTAWTPSILMPRQVCRLELRVKRITAPHVRAITKKQAIDEGWRYLKVSKMNPPPPMEWYRRTWDEINGKTGPLSWSSNPKVWRIEYEVAKCRK